MTAETPSAGWFEGREHRLAVRVYYEDTDFTGVVYHASYLRFFERGRTELLRSCGLGHAALLEGPDPCAFAVTRLAVSFRRPARIDDALSVETRLRPAGRVRFVADQRIVREEALIAEAEVEVVAIRPGGGPRRLPPDLLRRLAPGQGVPAP